MDSSQQAIVGYLDSVAAGAGLPAGPNIPQPWERPAEYDGTSAHEDEAESRAKAMALATESAAKL